jgi:hypothetical protein
MRLFPTAKVQLLNSVCAAVEWKALAVSALQETRVRNLVPVCSLCSSQQRVAGPGCIALEITTFFIALEYMGEIPSTKAKSLSGME